jgi:DNA-binding ferritin-like protein
MKKTPCETSQARRHKEKPGFKQIKDRMDEIAERLSRATEQIRQLMKLKGEFGDEIYFRALADAHNLRAAFAEWVVLAKYPIQEPDEW